MSEYIRTNKFDVKECLNIFVKKLIRTKIRIYIRDQYIWIFEYSNVFVTPLHWAPFCGADDNSKSKSNSDSNGIQQGHFQQDALTKTCSRKNFYRFDIDVCGKDIVRVGQWQTPSFVTDNLFQRGPPCPPFGPPSIFTCHILSREYGIRYSSNQTLISLYWLIKNFHDMICFSNKHLIVFIMNYRK